MSVSKEAILQGNGGKSNLEEPRQPHKPFMPFSERPLDNAFNQIFRGTGVTNIAQVYALRLTSLENVIGGEPRRIATVVIKMDLLMERLAGEDRVSLSAERRAIADFAGLPLNMGVKTDLISQLDVTTQEGFLQVERDRLKKIGLTDGEIADTLSLQDRLRASQVK